MLKRNLIANYLGQGWVVLMSLAFIPLYIRYLGIEAYGLIGVFTIFQAWLGLFDMSISPTMNREMAHFSSGVYNAQHVRDLLRSIEVIVFGIAIIIVTGMWLSSYYLSYEWIQAENISADVIQKIFVIIGFIIAFRSIEGIYRSSIIGLQRQVLFNILNCLVVTLRGVGAISILALFSPTVEAFFIWQGIISLFSTLMFALVLYKLIPLSQRDGQFSFSILSNISKFAGGIIGITFLSLLLTQMDKIILSKLLLLTEYGYYTLAVVVAGVLYAFIGPIAQAYFPRFSELYAHNNQVGFIEAYHQGSQLVTVVVGSMAIIIIVFSETILCLWTQNVELSRNAATLLRLLTLGNMFNGLMWMPYQAQLAHGWTGLMVRINLISVIIIIPTIVLVTPYYGSQGAAWVWLGLNVGYVLIGVHFMYRKILIKEKWNWYLYDITFPILTATITAIFIYWIAPKTEHVWGQVTTLVLAVCFTLVTAIFFAPLIRAQFLAYMKHFFLNRKINE